MSLANAKATQSMTISNADGLMITYETCSESSTEITNGEVNNTNSLNGNSILDLAKAFQMLTHQSARGFIRTDFASPLYDELKQREDEGD